MRVFLSYTTCDADFVIQVARYLKASLEHVFFFMDPEQNKGNFKRVIQQELQEADVMVVFAGGRFSEWQEIELQSVMARPESSKIRIMVFFIGQDKAKQKAFLASWNLVTFEIAEAVETIDTHGAIITARKILNKLQIPRGRFELDLPFDPHLFNYEKDIIQFFMRKLRVGERLHEEQGLDCGDDSAQEEERRWRKDAKKKLLNGCPSDWPMVEKWERNIRFWKKERWPNLSRWKDEPYLSQLDKEGAVFRGPENNVVAAALTTYLQQCHEAEAGTRHCIVKQGLCFPEAGPRQDLLFPPLKDENSLNVAILVSGGIAPGINAVIDGIVQRHWLYARNHSQLAGLTIYGLQNGFRAFDRFAESYFILRPNRGDHTEHMTGLVTSDHAIEGGSMLGTSRVDELMDPNLRLTRLENIVSVLRNNQIDILYIIGGDGSMKAAHAIWSFAKNTPGRPVSVVSVPKAMDNDILWVWQAFGFLSAVEKAREIIEHLHTEVRSNPRLCVLQLFGSDSGFVVGHSVLASATGHCDVALIPEVPFSMVRLAKSVKEKMCNRRQRMPYGLVVMAETAIPTDATDYVAPDGERPKIDLGLTREEQDAILAFQKLREEGKRIQGQTSDTLRKAGLKIVSKGLEILLPMIQLDPDNNPADGFMPEWRNLRVFTSEPRHLLRTVLPSCQDVIFAQRLGMLAVDSAMAGFTDFMISKWLTEYAVVPLSLVVLGRKRIPKSGIFWKSVLTKTRQPDDMVN